MTQFAQDSAPGFTTISESEEREILLNAKNRELLLIEKAVALDSAAVDAGNTPTTTLRAGLVLGIIASSGKYTVYDSDGTDGSQIAVAVLPKMLNMLGTAGVVEDKSTRVITRANLKYSQLPNIDAAAARSLIQLGFVFDAPAGAQALPTHRGVVTKAADYTVVAADNGVLFVATAAVNFTLPTKAHGLTFEFLQTADANMVITSAGSADDIIVDGDAGADTITYSTASHKIGSRCRVQCIYVGANLRWIVTNMGHTAMTIA